MNLATIVAGAVYGALAATPAPAGGVLICTPWGCRSSPYFPPPIVQVAPRVVYLPALYPPLGPDTPPPAYPLASPSPRSLHPSPAPPYPPLGNPPQWRRPDPPPRIDPPPKMSRQELEQQREIEGDIVAFCDAHPDEQFCGKLGAWFRAHPQGAPR